MTVYAILSTIFVYTRVKSRTRATMNEYNVMTDLQVLAVVGYKAPMSDIRLKKGVTSLLLRNHSGCRKGEAQCVSAVWYQGGHLVHKTSCQNPC